jgi:hypothetical protein
MFIANTDIAYGNTRISRLSYQMINTLALDDKKFKTLTEQHLDYVENPIEYLKFSEDYCPDKEPRNDIANWKRALFINPDFANCCYIKQQLKNTQSSLMKQFASGRLVVPGQMRYLVRDLGFMLARLIGEKSKSDSVAAKIKVFDYKFFMPQGDADNNSLNLNYENWYSFFRSPHLSRNEQCLLRAFIPSENADTLKQPWYNADRVKETYRILNKYFGHLTGIVMVGNESLVPMALGGADFDGDLVNIVLDQTVAKAVKEGVYDNNYDRKIPYVEVPSNEPQENKVPKYISFESINNTFSNKIGMISDAAICIGQTEYGKEIVNNSIPDTDKNVTDELTCAKCTILTGLEIDAAKHGRHPDLSLIEGKDYKCDFLEFSREFVNLSKHPKFHMNQLKAELSKNDDDEETWELSIRNTDESISYPKWVKGTYINRLPHVFMEHLGHSLPKGDTKALNDLFKISAKVKKDSDFIELESICKSHLDFYKKTLRLFENDDVQKVVIDGYYRQKNLNDLLIRLYDEKTVADIYENQLPSVYRHINRFISTGEDLRAFRDTIYRENWHLITEDKKKACLKSIFESISRETDSSINIGEMLSGNEWNFLLVQRDGGYKLLWYIINLNAKKLKLLSKIEELKNHIKKANITEEYQARIIDEIETYNEKLFDKDEQKEYHIPDFITKAFYTSLSEVIDRYKIDPDDKVRLIFNLTKKEPKLRELFWNCFSWDELKSVIISAKTEKEAHRVRRTIRS